MDRAKTLLLRGLLLPLAQQYAERDEQQARQAIEAPVSVSDVKPTPEPADEGDTAVSGREGILAEQLLLTAKNQAVKVLAAITRAAVLRLLADPRWLRTARGMYSPGEKQQLVDLFTATSATANLLGRARIRGRLGKPLSQHSEIFLQFADAAPLKPLLPEAAIAYFKGLQPGIDLDPQRFGADQRRRAFTLAGITEKTILEKVKGIIADGLESGESSVGLANKVGQVLTAAGISKTGAYLELVVRTNILDALNRGAEDELKGLRDTFPYWRYDGIPDGREREGHAIHFGKVFPATMSFFTVRDSYYGGEYSGFNCRCSTTALTLEQALAIDPTIKGKPLPPAVKAPKPVTPVVAPVPPIDVATVTPESVAGMSRKELDALAEQMGVTVGKKSTAALRTRLATDLEQRAILAARQAAPVVPPVPAVPVAPPVAAGALNPEAAVAAAYQRVQSYGQASIADLKDATGLDTATLHGTINTLRRQGLLVGSQVEGQITERVAASLIREGDDAIGYVSARQGREKDLLAVATGKPEPTIPQVKFAALPVERRAAVLQAVADATKVGGFGDNKVFISAAYETAKLADPSLTYAEFQRLLVEASQRGELALGRADLVSIMDPQAVKASATKTVGDKEAHFIIVAKNNDRVQAINPLYKATTAARETYEYTPAEYLQDSGAATERSKAITLSIHKRAVEEALAAGKVVPDDVLVSYPDLVQKYRRKP